MTDIQIRDEGTIILLTPTSTAGREWCAEWINENGPQWSGAYVVERRYVADILDLHCVDEGIEVDIEDGKFEEYLEGRSTHLEREVQGRNSRYYDQQEELLYRNQQDRRAESEGKIREYKAKEKEARKGARGTDDPMEQLKFKKEARKWAERAEEEDEEARDARKKMREEADRYLELIEQALKGTQAIEQLFTIRWKVVA